MKRMSRNVTLSVEFQTMAPRDLAGMGVVGSGISSWSPSDDILSHLFHVTRDYSVIGSMTGMGDTGIKTWSMTTGASRKRGQED